MPKIEISPDVLDELINNSPSETGREILPYADSFPVIICNSKTSKDSKNQVNDKTQITETGMIFCPASYDKTPVLDLGMLEPCDKRIINLWVIEAGGKELKVDSMVSDICQFDFTPKSSIPGIPIHYEGTIICKDELSILQNQNDKINITLADWKEDLIIEVKWSVCPDLPIVLEPCFSTNNPLHVDFGIVPYRNECEISYFNKDAKEVFMILEDKGLVMLKDWEENGNHSVFIPLEDGKYKYKFKVDDTLIIDPSNSPIEGEEYSILEHFPSIRRFKIHNQADEEILLDFSQKGDWFNVEFISEAFITDRKSIRFITDIKEKMTSKKKREKKEGKVYTLNPGEKAELRISIPETSRKEGEFEGVFIIRAKGTKAKETGELSFPEKEVPLSIKAVIIRHGPEIGLEENVVDFGEVYKGRTHEKTLKVSNHGQKPLFIFFQDQAYTIGKVPEDIPVVLNTRKYTDCGVFFLIESNSIVDPVQGVNILWKTWDYNIEPSFPIFKIEKAGVQDGAVKINRSDQKPVELKFIFPQSLENHIEFTKIENGYFLIIKEKALSEFQGKKIEEVVECKDQLSGECFQISIMLEFYGSLLNIEPAEINIIATAPWWRYDEFKPATTSNYRVKGTDQSFTTLEITRKDGEASDIKFQWKEEFIPYLSMEQLPDNPGKYALEISQDTWKKFPGKIKTSLLITDESTGESSSIPVILDLLKADLVISPEKVDAEIQSCGRQEKYPIEIRRGDAGEIDLVFKLKDEGEFNQSFSLTVDENDPNIYYLNVSSEQWNERPEKHNLSFIVNDRIGGEEATIDFNLRFINLKPSFIEERKRPKIKKTVPIFSLIFVALLVIMMGFYFMKLRPTTPNMHEITLPPHTNPPLSGNDILTLNDENISSGPHRLPEGDYKLVITKKGYMPKTYNFTVPDDVGKSGKDIIILEPINVFTNKTTSEPGKTKKTDSISKPNEESTTAKNQETGTMPKFKGQSTSGGSRKGATKQKTNIRSTEETQKATINSETKTTTKSSSTSTTVSSPTQSDLSSKPGSVKVEKTPYDKKLYNNEKQSIEKGFDTIGSDEGEKKSIERGIEDLFPNEGKKSSGEKGVEDLLHDKETTR